MEKGERTEGWSETEEGAVWKKGSSVSDEKEREENKERRASTVG